MPALRKLTVGWERQTCKQIIRIDRNKDYNGCKYLGVEGYTEMTAKAILE